MKKYIWLQLKSFEIFFWLATNSLFGKRSAHYSSCFQQLLSMWISFVAFQLFAAVFSTLNIVFEFQPRLQVRQETGASKQVLFAAICLPTLAQAFHAGNIYFFGAVFLSFFMAEVFARNLQTWFTPTKVALLLLGVYSEYHVRNNL